MTALLKAISLLGSQAELAKRTECSPQVINNWLRRQNVPAEHCPSIEKATDGHVRCEDLRPDVDWAYLRNTCKPALDQASDDCGRCNLEARRSDTDRRAPDLEQKAA